MTTSKAWHAAYIHNVFVPCHAKIVLIIQTFERTTDIWSIN